MPRRLVEVCLWMCQGCDVVVAKGAYTALDNMDPQEPPVRQFVCPVCGEEKLHSPVALRTSDHTLHTEFVTLEA